MRGGKFIPAAAILCLLFASCGEKQAETEELPDYAPPVMIGVEDIRIQVGEDIDLLADVTAFDTVDGEVEVEVDTSGFHPEREGLFTVTYRAQDKSGNVSEKTAQIKVSSWDGIPVSQDTVDALADEVLAELLTDDLTERERVEAIYRWVTQTLTYRNSVREQELLDFPADAAYEGFTEHRGNCFAFYSVTAELLTRAGIENRKVERDPPTYGPHYWNLVRVDGDWYHIDTTPREGGGGDAIFLLTDAELEAFDELHRFDAEKYPATP